MIELLAIFAKSLPDLGLIVLALSIAFAYCGAPLILYLVTFAFYFLKFDFGSFFWISYAAFAVIYAIPFIRSIIVTKLIVVAIKKLGLLPKISETEKIALTSGTVWVDGQLFSGKPDFKWIFSQKYPQLTAEEQSYIDNEVEEVCKMCVDYDVQHLRDLPPHVWQYLKDKKFFGMIIPKEYGGLGFSAYFHSAVIQKLASRSVPLAITVMVPNSLGPAELLMHYGTKEQRDHYLPRLADGRELPCFALTEAGAGSDATSIISNGVLFKDSDGSIKIRLNWSKRYITLGAVATVIGVAFQLRDPDKILFDHEDAGITCALVPHDTAGVIQGRRHDPLSTPFINSPLNGENVIIGLDAIIGGQGGLGKGWKMLMECLAAGRGISLPSTGCGGSKFVARAISAYSATRQQFGTTIAKFEGVEEVLARIVGRTYTAEALRSFTAGAIDSGSKPAVITAIAKYAATEIFRQVINDGMDIMGGRAIIKGPRNLLANAYFSAPISITVEGANIMTRSLIHFGQGAIMCHPYAYAEVEALEKNDIKGFDQAFFSHIKHLLRNFTRSIVLSITRGRLVCTSCLPHEKIVRKYQRKLAWASASFAFLADIAMARFGGDLKRKEKLNGRFGDILSALYLSVCILRKFIEDGSKKEDEVVVEYAIKEQLGKAQQAFDGIYQNLFSGFGKFILLPFAFWSRFNAFVCPANDALSHLVVKNFTKNGDFRDSLTKGIFVSPDKNDNLGRLENAMKLYEASAGSIEKIKLAIRNKILPRKRVEDLLSLAHEKSVISSSEFSALQETFAAVLDAMQVDEYSLEDYKKI
jgi:acyl-CoA dehydrogenase